MQEPDGHNIKLLWADFLASIARNRKPVADIEQAHRASTLSLLGMLSWRAGRSLTWDGAKEELVNDAAASKLLARDYRKPWVFPKG